MLRFFLMLFMACGTAFTALAAPDAKEFGKLPSVYDAAISPNAKRIALIANIKGQYGILVVGSEDLSDKPRIIMLGEGVKPQWIKWASNDHVLLEFGKANEWVPRRLRWATSTQWMQRQ